MRVNRATQVQPKRDKVVQPDRKKIRELSDIMRDISNGYQEYGDRLNDGLDERIRVTKLNHWSEIDADGNIIPDF